MSDMYFENLPSTSTPITASNLNKLNDIKVSATTPTNGEKVWFKQGKNLFNAYGFSYTIRNNKESYTINNTNSISVSGDNMTWSRIGIIIKNLKPSTQYTISASVSNPSGHSSGFVVLEGSTERNSISTETSFNPKVVFTSNSDGTITINLFSNWSGTALSETVTFSQLQLEQNSDKTTYESYIEQEIYVKNDNNIYQEFNNNVVDSLVGNETNKAPSVNSVKKRLGGNYSIYRNSANSTSIIISLNNNVDRQSLLLFGANSANQSILSIITTNINGSTSVKNLGDVTLTASRESKVVTISGFSTYSYVSILSNFEIV